MLNVKLLLLLCSLGLVGCNGLVHAPPPTVPTDGAPIKPEIKAFLSPASVESYHIGMLRYRDALLVYMRNLSDYIQYMTIAEGFRNSMGKPCTLPYDWEPMVIPILPDTPSTDLDTVNSILANHVRALRLVIIDKNKEYAPCVK